MSAMKKTSLLFAFALVSACFTQAAFAAATVFVSDNNSPETPIIRWLQFATTVSASVDNPPQSTQETTITGPNYSWAIVSQSPSNPTFTVAQSNNPSTTVTSPVPTSSVFLSGGRYTVTVSCTVTYTSTDNKTGAQTPVQYSGTGIVGFLVRIPYNVVKNGAKVSMGVPSGDVGHDDAYPLRLMDNQPTPQPYTNGLLHETFSNVVDGNGHPMSSSLLNSGGPATWGLAADSSGYATGPGSTTSDITDYWSDVFTQAAYNQSGANGNTVLDNFDQPWYCLELLPSDPGQAYNPNYVIAGQFKITGTNPDNPQLPNFNSNVNATQLVGGQGSTHHGQDQVSQSLRSYPGQPAY